MLFATPEALLRVLTAGATLPAALRRCGWAFKRVTPALATVADANALPRHRFSAHYDEPLALAALAYGRRPAVNASAASRCAGPGRAARLRSPVTD